ncbi:GNAT family N-acetyltransferase [Halorubrum aethiopicum]|uniref:GNAT family N-acetyltransferase n=1 Tax=Halorubrum aethiopicum TaxID=1758255 RepID=UPI00082E2B1B|nr:GNAT family N-acetyltransferase [Halorubrum aethiopicum]
MIRAYSPERDADALWDLKRQFELELGGNTGGEEKSTKYQDKVDEEYQNRYLDWTRRCIESDPDCISIAEVDQSIVGYAFVLPENFAMIWDAAVLNEIFIMESHRGTGVADDLMQSVLETAKKQDLPLDRLLLDVDEDNERAQAFYQRYDFKKWGDLVARSV